MIVPLGLALGLLGATALADEDNLWPPREGSKRAVVAASQQLWWDKDDPKSRIAKARALDFSGRYAEAEQAALSALEVAPRDPEVQRILGRSLFHQNKLAAAKAARSPHPPRRPALTSLPGLKFKMMWGGRKPANLPAR